MKKGSYIPDDKIVNPPSPDLVYKEVKRNFTFSYPQKEFKPVKKIFNDFKALFSGKYPGYRACDTPYHDIKHSSDVFLAASRIVDGYNLENPKHILPSRKVIILYAASLFHDSGFIPKTDDRASSGAENLSVHEERSQDFTESYMLENGFTDEEALLACTLIECTNLFRKISDLEFNSDTDRMLGCIMGTADLIGQMASRTYLERLPSLYQEFSQAEMPVYFSEVDLVQRTGDFYETVVKKRLQEEFRGVMRYTKKHFRERRNIFEDIYKVSIENQIDYIQKIVKEYPDTYKEKLRRTES